MPLDHHCHALGCVAECEPKMLMCNECWSKVPAEMQKELYRTVGLRGKYADHTWAAWWRAQAYAIHYVAMLKEPNKEKGERWLTGQLATADILEKKK